MSLLNTHLSHIQTFRILAQFCQSLIVLMVICNKLTPPFLSTKVELGNSVENDQDSWRNSLNHTQNGHKFFNWIWYVLFQIVFSSL